MSVLTYDDLLTELFPRLTGGIRWGLERTGRLLAHVGDPHRSFHVMHVGGTNGKGSVAAHLDSVLRADGRHVGLYSSPHLCTFRERIRIGGRAIDEAALLAAAERLWPAIQAETPSFFEATTAIAFLALADAGIDTAVVEVGLGGRLDATNVVTPDAVVLTNVSLDHVQLLGPTIEHVAREKAGIIKPLVPVITAEIASPALDLFRDTARAARAPMRALDAGSVRVHATDVTGTDFTVAGTAWGPLRLHTPLIGPHQALNAALAVHALDTLGDRRPSLDGVVQGIAATHWPGRLQYHRLAGVPWLFDVAHNVAGVEALVAALRALALPGPITAIVGVLGDKDWRNMLTPLYEIAADVVLTMPPTAPPERRWDPAEALAAAPSDRARIVTDFTAALNSAYERASAAGGAVLVTGSFHTVGDALTACLLCDSGSDVTLPRPDFLQS